MLKEVITFKSGKFIFSSRFLQKRIMPLFYEITVLYLTVRDLPILPNLSAKMNEELLVESIFGTAAIEGNPLSKEEVDEIVNKPGASSSSPDSWKTEISNLKDAYNYAKRFSESKEKLSEQTIKEIHRIATVGVEHPYNVPGQYRQNKVKVGDNVHGGVYIPPKCYDDVCMLMKKYLEFIYNENVVEGPGKGLVQAALAHYYFGLVHPFADGNGRTGRLIEAIILNTHGYKFLPLKLSNYYYQNKDEYFAAFSAAIKSKTDTTPFLEFCLTGMKDALYDLQERIKLYIRLFLLREYFVHAREAKQITQRQFDLLNCLLNSFEPITFQDLYSKPPYNILYRSASEQTARRDIKKLVEKGILHITQEKKYTLNLHHLDAIGGQ